VFECCRIFPVKPENVPNFLKESDYFDSCLVRDYWITSFKFVDFRASYEDSRLGDFFLLELDFLGLDSGESISSRLNNDDSSDSIATSSFILIGESS
jgi:hypothetical protein